MFNYLDWFRKTLILDQDNGIRQPLIFRKSKPFEIKKPPYLKDGLNYIIIEPPDGIEPPTY